MPEARFQLQDDLLSESEVNSIWDLAHRAPEATGGATEHDIRVRDIAEATGLDQDAVLAHLRRIRGEEAFGYKEPRKPFPVLPLVAVAVLAMGASVTVFRIIKANNPSPVKPIVAPLVNPATPGPLTMRPQPVTDPISINTVQQGPGATPPGLQANIVGQRTQYVGQGTVLDHVRPMDYDEERKWLADAAANVVQTVVAADAGSTENHHGPYRDVTGIIVQPRPGQVHYSLTGWPGTVSGWLTVPLTDAGRHQLLDEATKLLSDARQEQNTALETRLNPRDGIVTPAPGFRIELRGRRVDRQEGPHISFLPIDPATVRQRMLLAIENAIVRDGQPPKGAWTRSAAQEAKVPYPDESQVTVSGPHGEWTFNIPTADGWGPEAERVAAREASKAADQIAAENKKERPTRGSTNH